MDAIYARQSVDKKDSISIEAQIQSGLRVSGDKPNTIYNKDKGFSGKNTDRPDFQRLVEDIKNGLINRVIVYKIDRISRSIVDFADIMQLFEKYKVEFVSVTESFDTSTPIGRAMLYIIMIFAQLERETIQERVRSNYYERMKVGIGKGGRPPFGFEKVPAIILGKNTKILQAKEPEASLVREIYNIYADTDITLHRLKQKMTFESDLKPFFTDVFLNLLLRNPIYAKANADVYMYLKSKGAMIENELEDFIGINGCFAYADAKERTHMRFTDLSKTHIALQPHEGIIDADTWIKCNYKLDKNKAFKNSGASNFTWLAGLMKCRYCGFAAFATGNGPRTNPDDKYLNCRGRKKNICFERTRTYTVSVVEAVVGRLLLDYLKQQRDTKLVTTKKNNDSVINALKIELGGIENKIQNLIASIAGGNQTFAKYANQMIEELDKERERVNAEIVREMMNGKADYEPSDVDRDFIVNNWDSFACNRKKKIANLIIKSVTISNDGIDVNFL